MDAQFLIAVAVILLAGAYLAWRFLGKKSKGSACSGCPFAEGKTPSCSCSCDGSGIRDRRPDKS